MADKNLPDVAPPKLSVDPKTREADMNSLADLLEWFLTYDERTARIRHPHVNELFLWKQSQDTAAGSNTYQFESAEARFAIGAIQALAENNSEPLLKLWITDVLNALHESRETKTKLADTYRLGDNLDASPLERSDKLTTNTEKRLYLTSSWIEALCTAEARFLGWVYQEIYGRPFSP
jgi:hypothetical protein